MSFSSDTRIDDSSQLNSSDNRSAHEGDPVCLAAQYLPIAPENQIVSERAEAGSLGNHEVDDDDSTGEETPKSTRSRWRSELQHTMKNATMRRLFLAKFPGRKSLAPISPNHCNTAQSGARRVSKAESIPSPGTPENTPPLDFRVILSSNQVEVQSVEPPIRPGTEELLSETLSRLSCDAEAIDGHQDATYKPISLSVSSSSIKGLSGAKVDNHTSPVAFVSTPHRSTTKVTGSTTTVIAERDFNTEPQRRNNSKTKKGHSRMESVDSIWTFHSSSESDSSPPLLERRFQPTQTRPPLPKFHFGGGTLAQDQSNYNEGRARSGNHMRSSSASTTRPAKTSRASSRTISGTSSHTRSRTASPEVLKTIHRPSESWDDDFDEPSLAIPDKVRQSQATVRDHLWQLHYFANLIAQLKDLRSNELCKSITSSSKEYRIQAEVNAVIAIASYGEDLGNTETINYDGIQDETLARILKRARIENGKVKLDGEILYVLNEKAARLVEEMELFLTDENW